MTGVNFLVFREQRRPVQGRELKSALIERLLAPGIPSEENLIDLLLRAGELESAIADEGSVPLAPWEEATQLLATALLDRDTPLTRLPALIDSASVPQLVQVSPPEGFAYYALHPKSFAKAAADLALPQRVMVVGIRTIGTVLSAMVAAALKLRGIHVQRITVRPEGHPYNRHASFSSVQLDQIQLAAAQSSAFLIVDEGPGLSGSSFISVGEALLDAGVLPDSITFLCSSEPRVDSLCAPDGPQRWRRFRHVAVTDRPKTPAEAEVFIGGGEWRKYLIPDRDLWPASWASFERLKYLPAHHQSPRCLKFLGFGRYGDEVREREHRLWDAGFAPPIQKESHGFCSFPWLDGRPMMAKDLSEAVLSRLASYCAFRAHAFPAQIDSTGALGDMASHNLRQLGFGPVMDLKVVHPVIADARMHPHEWVLCRSGEMLKTDGGGHGDDHFYPGPTDIAWDLAGAIVEWQMSAHPAQLFLEMYRRASGDDAADRMVPFVTAYAAFRCAYSLMAAKAMAGTEEALRMEAAAAQYGGLLLRPAAPGIPLVG